MPLMMMERYKRKTRIITFMLLVILGVVGQVEDVCAAPWHYGGWLLMIYFYGRQTSGGGVFCSGNKSDGWCVLAAF